MKNFPAILFFQFYRYPDELIEQSELKRAFTMSTTKRAMITAVITLVVGIAVGALQQETPNRTRQQATKRRS